MVYLTYLKYILQNTAALYVRNTKLLAQDCALVLDASATYYLLFFFKYSYFFKKTVLVDIGGYDLPLYKRLSAISASLVSPVVWYIFKEVTGARLLVFSFNFKSKHHASVESLFRNARWLEREATDFYGFFFSNKSDRRSLFTLPLFYEAPFKKKYPVLGVYELFFCPILKKLKFKHLSVQV